MNQVNEYASLSSFNLLFDKLTSVLLLFCNNKQQTRKPVIIY